MNLRIFGLLAIVVALAVAGVLGSTQSRAQNAYITNQGSATVSVIDTASNTVIAAIPVGGGTGVAVSPGGRSCATRHRASPFNS